jgi:hypothetical protein
MREVDQPMSGTGTGTGTGANVTDGADPGRSRAPWEFKALLSFVAVLGVGIVLAWTLVGSRSPERLEPAAAAQLSAACDDAQARLKTVPNAFPRTGPDRVARIRTENEVLRTMIRRFGEVRPRAATPAAAVRGWTDDWSKAVDARERYANDLETKKTAQFVLPSTQGLKPITKNMDDFVRENHPNLDACFVDALALETVEGPREYKEVTG